MGPVAYFSLCLLGCLVFNPSLAVEEHDAPCPRSWRFIEGTCYRYFSEERTWDSAEDVCRSHCRAHLASIQSAEENNMLTCYIKENHKKNTPVWIGLQNRNQNGDWRWADESPFNFTAWDNGQPDNLGGNENCTGLDQNTGFQKWHDYPCESTFSFVCKF